MAGGDASQMPAALDPNWINRKFEAIEQWQREMMPSVAQSVIDIVAALVLRPGVIVEYGSTTAPVGFLLCDGTQYPQATYPDLYAVIGASFNTGGETAGYFRVPDKRGRVGVGYDASQAEFNAVGKTGGAKTHSLTGSENGVHGHPFSGSDTHSHTIGTRLTGITGSNLVAPGSSVPTIAGTTQTNSASGSTTVTISGTTDDSGSGAPHNNLQPYIAVPYIIKY